MSNTDTRQALARKLVDDFAVAFLYGNVAQRIAAGDAIVAALATQPAQPSARPLTAREASVMHKALLRSSKFVEPAQPSAQGEAVAWLVEWKAHGYGPQWWGFNHTPGKNATWCSDANNAIRFARKEDAERMRLHIIAVAGLTGMHEYERSVSVTEHMWEGPCRAN